MEKVIYRASPLEVLTNRYWQLQRLQEEGQDMTPEIEETWKEIKNIVELGDRARLVGIRKRIGKLIKEQVKQNEP